MSKPVSIYPPDGSIQRYAFIEKGLVDKDRPDLTPAMKEMAGDEEIRQYNDLDELKSHAGKETDYLGNLEDGTWVRFSPTGLNLLGEVHTHVNFLEVGPAVGAKSFIYEPFASDDLAGTPELKKTYEKESQERFKTAGIAGQNDKKAYGAESLFPKIGYAFMRSLPYLASQKAAKDLRTGKDYIGQPIQRYLKLAWAHSKDNVLEVKAKQLSKDAIPAKKLALAEAHEKLEETLDPFIVPLPVDGYLGDALVKEQNAGLLEPLRVFIVAYLDALDELVRSSEERLNTNQGKEDMFSEWRDISFADNVNRARKSGVRYAGMGNFHLEALTKKGLEKGDHPYDMDDVDLEAFQKNTRKLRKSLKT